MINPNLFKFRRAQVRVDTTDKKTRGRTTITGLPRRASRSDTLVAIDVDVESVRSSIMKGLTRNRF
jgi:inosine-uridine nucleoside N-ribohydrolase